MANWFYRNRNNEKVGPISTNALKALAAQGLITPETVIENGNGRSAVAGKVNGLEFSERTEPLPPEPEIVTIDDIEPSSVSPEPEATAAMQFGNVPIHTVPAPEQSEVYGLSAPKPAPPVEANPFTATGPKKEPPVEANPFTVAQAVTETEPPIEPPVVAVSNDSPAIEEPNPFAATASKKEKPSIAVVPVVVQARQPKTTVPDAKSVPKPIIFGGIALVVGALLLVVFGGGSPKTESTTPGSVNRKTLPQPDDVANQAMGLVEELMSSRGHITNPDKDAIRRVCRKASKIDVSGCPSSFQRAFREFESALTDFGEAMIEFPSSLGTNSKRFERASDRLTNALNNLAG